jgi:rhamnulokinase
LRLNTLYQLYADRLAGAPPGRRWLNLPEYLLSHWGGEPVSEFTNASHTQLVDLQSGLWSEEIFNAAELDLDCAPRLVPPGTVLGHLRGPLTALLAFNDTLLIAPACHDTASALAGIPAHGDEWAYISSGTWSLVGALVQQPLINANIRADNFTNLGGVGGTTCFHRNVNGMWLLKQCMDTWAASGTSLSLEGLLCAAETLTRPAALLTVDDPELLLVGDMPARINIQRMRNGLLPLDESPANAAEVVALILHSLAARYAEVLARLQAHTGKQLKRIFIVGGGSRNDLLNRLTTEATRLEVVCGPAESSTIGNLAVQMAVLEGGNPCTSPAFAGDVARWAAALHPIPVAISFPTI